MFNWDRYVSDDIEQHYIARGEDWEDWEKDEKISLMLFLAKSNLDENYKIRLEKFIEKVFEINSFEDLSNIDLNKTINWIFTKYE